MRDQAEWNAVGIIDAGVMDLVAEVSRSLLLRFSCVAVVVAVVTMVQRMPSASRTSEAVFAVNLVIFPVLLFFFFPCSRSGSVYLIYCPARPVSKEVPSMRVECQCEIMLLL